MILDNIAAVFHQVKTNVLKYCFVSFLTFISHVGCYVACVVQDNGSISVSSKRRVLIRQDQARISTAVSAAHCENVLSLVRWTASKYIKM